MDVDRLMVAARKAAEAWLTVDIAGDYHGDGTPVETSPLVLLAREADEAVRAAAQALAVPAGWQPIETAPRGSGEDGPGQTTHPDYIAPPRLLLATAEGIVVGYYDWYYHPGYGVGAEPNESVWRDHDGGRTYGVTHWMPLPAVPQEPRDA